MHCNTVRPVPTPHILHGYDVYLIDTPKALGLRAQIWSNDNEGLELKFYFKTRALPGQFTLPTLLNSPQIYSSLYTFRRQYNCRTSKRSARYLYEAWCDRLAWLCLTSGFSLCPSAPFLVLIRVWSNK